MGSTPLHEQHLARSKIHDIYTIKGNFFPLFKVNFIPVCNLEHALQNCRDSEMYLTYKATSTDYIFCLHIWCHQLKWTLQIQNFRKKISCCDWPTSYEFIKRSSMPSTPNSSVVYMYIWRSDIGLRTTHARNFRRIVQFLISAQWNVSKFYEKLHSSRRQNEGEGYCTKM